MKEATTCYPSVEIFTLVRAWRRSTNGLEGLRVSVGLRREKSVRNQSDEVEQKMHDIYGNRTLHEVRGISAKCILEALVTREEVGPNGKMLN